MPPGVEHAVLDQVHGALREAGDRIDARVARRELGTAAQARPVALDLGGRGAREEAAVLAARQPHVADRPAVDPRRRHADEEPAVETGVVRRQRAVAGVGIERHGADYASATHAATRRFRTWYPRPGTRAANLRIMAAFARCSRALRRRASMTRLARLLLAVPRPRRALAAHAQPPERLVFATDWLAQAEHGGFYQARRRRHLPQARPRRDDPDGRPAGQRPAAPRRRAARRRDGRRAAGALGRRAERPGHRDRRDVPEESDGDHRAPRRREDRGPQGQADRDERGGQHDVLAVAASSATASPTTRSGRTRSASSRSSSTRTCRSRGSRPPSRSRSRRAA